jgi:hypothetical protein
MSPRTSGVPPLPHPHPPVTTAFRLVSGAAWSRAERAEPGRHFGIAPRNHSLSTMFLPPALIVSHFWLGTGQTCFKNPGFGWRSGEKACSSQAIKTGQFRVRACTLLNSPTRSRGSHQLGPHLSACLAVKRTPSRTACRDIKRCRTPAAVNCLSRGHNLQLFHHRDRARSKSANSFGPGTLVDLGPG